MRFPVVPNWASSSFKNWLKRSYPHLHQIQTGDKRADFRTNPKRNFQLVLHANERSEFDQALRIHVGNPFFLDVRDFFWIKKGLQGRFSFLNL